jgi:hypothetical protein
MGAAHGTYGELVDKHRKRPGEKNMCRWEDNIKINLEETGQLYFGNDSELDTSTYELFSHNDRYYHLPKY